MSDAPTFEDLVLLEMTYTTFEDCCGDSTIDEAGELRQCRRTRGHAHRGDGRHASGHPLVVWGR